MWGVGWAKDGKSVAFGTSNVTQPNGTRPLDFTFRFDDFGPGPRADESKYQQLLGSDNTFTVVRLPKDVWAIGPLTGNGKLRQLDVPDAGANLFGHCIAGAWTGRRRGCRCTWTSLDGAR